MSITNQILEQLNQIQAQADLDNRHLTAEVYVLSDKNQLFGQKRASDRRLFPNCWDVPGGHLDEGETLYQCIVRELKEETNWDLDRIIDIIGIEDWNVPIQSQKEGDNPNKRMVKVLVKVKNINDLVLEEGKVTEGKWFESDDLDRLLEGDEDRSWRKNSFQEVFSKISV